MEDFEKRLLNAQTDKERDKVFKELAEDTTKLIARSKSLLISQGEVIDLTEWLTVQEYSKRFGIKTPETVMNWINRGNVPAENVRVVPELNNIRLIKAIPYQVRPKKANHVV